MNLRLAAQEIFLAGVNSVLPTRLITNSLAIAEDGISVGKRFFPLDMSGSLFVVGAGKASAMMASGAESVLGDLITDGHVVVKYGFSCRLKHLRITEAAHPAPDINSFKASEEILEIVTKAGSNDLVLCLISGGGSSLLADLPEGISGEDLLVLNNKLVNSGASISEINTVRKHISLIKGGQLARAAYPAQVVSLIISDVPGDKLDVIASGPTVADPGTFDEALDVISRYHMVKSIPASIMTYLYKGAEGKVQETPKPGDPLFSRVSNIIVGNNRLALEAALRKAANLNMDPFIEDDCIQGDVHDVAEKIVKSAVACRTGKSHYRPVCLLFGGETTLRMTGKGLGGRNQHLALLIASLLKDYQGITVLAGGTDGNDGPTDAAGAVVDSATSLTAEAMKLDIQEYINNFDSWNFFKRAGGHIITGPTMTNVMDMVVVIIE
ncbi:MAG TPA: glycerate kinase [Bacteroidales bacterium]|nr:glycerate kinase [Bacteroidales bacterium]